MLEVGRQRQADNELIEFVHADATKLPFKDNEFDAVTISFGLRNVNEPKKALAEMLRVTKPGGRIVICEFSHPPLPFIRAPYFFYTKYLMPKIAGLVNGASDAYDYLNDSIVDWPEQATLAEWMREAGFEQVAYRNLTAGIVALHRGTVPAAKPAQKKPATKPAQKKPATKPAAKTTPAKKTAVKPTAKTPATKPVAAKAATK
jgi:demethylmenaquinone methyltransferase/2-methoxy-6-polyprenyl-1,4-benzoquinol methylase